MSRFNPRQQARPRVTGPAETTGERTLTHEGAPAWVRTAQTDLVLLALTNLVGQDTFYESAADRDDRFRTLVRTVAAEDPVWTGKFIAWLRSEAHMRTASVVAAAETAHTMLGAGVPGARKVIGSALQRADEPGEFLGYWMAAYGRNLPMAVKRGVGDAALRLYTERSLLKYDTASHGLRFGDVIELTHIPDTPGAAQHLAGPWQGDLFRHAIDRRHNRADRPVPDSLNMLHCNANLRRQVAEGDTGGLLRPDVLARAGMTWEDAKSLGGQYGLESRVIWEAMIPSMGYMALLRNLRNFDQAGISERSVQSVTGRLTDPDEVARSRQLPFRFLSAYKEVAGTRWLHPLDVATTHACSNVPAVGGRSLVAVDVSGSMSTTVSERSRLSRMEAGALFGSALAVRGQDVTLVAFGTTSEQVPVPPGASALRLVDAIRDAQNRVDWGTNIAPALQAHYAGHDQVFVFTDEQAWGDQSGWGMRGGGDVSASVPPNVPLFSFNLAGYAPSMLDLSQPNRYAVGGFSDKLFTLITVLLAGSSARWPWEG
jgi:hypothetical protein